MSIVLPPPVKLKCSSCDHSFVEIPPIFGSVNSEFGGGIINSRNYFLNIYEAPLLNDYFKCPKCGKICDTDDIIEKDLKIDDYLEDKKKHKKTRKLPNKMDVLKTLIQTKRFDKYPEKHLLIVYWASCTDKLESFNMNVGQIVSDKNYKPDEFGSPDQIYIDRLLDLLDEKDEKDRLLKIEVLRSLGNFSEAKNFVDFDFTNSEYLNVLEKEIEHIDNKSTESFIIKELPQITI